MVTKLHVSYHFKIDGFVRLKADDQLISEGVQVGGQLSCRRLELDADLYLALVQGLACL